MSTVVVFANSQSRARVLSRSTGWICDACRNRPLTSERKLSIHARARDSKALSRSFIASRSNVSSNETPLNFRRFASKKSRYNGEKPDYLPQYPVRTRFAPSPTGDLHIGGLRTALFSYLIAKRTGGQFILRIEDTDQKRLVSGAEERLMHELRWAGVIWDEGPDIGGPYGPYKQSERNHIYQQYANRLLDDGTAYRCFCATQQTQSDTQTYAVSGCYQSCSSLDSEHSRHRAEGQKLPFTVRLRERQQRKSYPDLVYGQIVPLKRSKPMGEDAHGNPSDFSNDTILIKSDKTPTYHFANVIDDHLMRVTHVIRGTEWMASTPLHVDLYHALGWQPPIFAHVGLLVDEEQAKLSKRLQREGGVALDVRGIRSQRHLLPEALCNYLVLLGWRYPGSNETCTMDDLKAHFDLRFTRGNAMVTMDKLTHFQKKHALRRCEKARSTGSNESVLPIAEAIVEEVKRQHLHAQDGPIEGDALLNRVLQILLSGSIKYEDPEQFVQDNAYFFDRKPSEESPEADVVQSNVGSESSKTGMVFGLLKEFDYGKAFQESPFIRPSSKPAPPTINPQFGQVYELSNRIRAAIDQIVWQAVIPEDVPKAEVPFTESSLDQDALAKHICAQTKTSDLDSKDLIERKTASRNGLIHHLRDRLAFGMPGMAMETVMAILGYEECCRRLGVEYRKDKSW